MTEPRTRMRLKVLATLFVLIFAGITTRLWFLQVLASEQFSALANQNQVRLVSIQPVRGLILDRDGNVLVGNRPSSVVTVDRLAMRESGEEVLLRLSELLDVNIDDLVERVNSPRYAPYQPVPVAEDVPEETIFYLREHERDFPGVDYELSSVRDYPEGVLAAHVLGYVGEISEEQLDALRPVGYLGDEIVGKAGVEATYERLLYGTRGQRAIQVNAQGDILDRDFGGPKPAEPGANLVLAIDTEIQKLTERSLTLGIQLGRRTIDENTEIPFKATGGAAVVMDPRNGQILAMASFPTYEPSLFLGGLTAAERAPLEDEANNFPQLNRVIQGKYPAGSTFKPFVAAGALKRKMATLDGLYDCPGEFVVPKDESGTVFNNWEPVNRGFITLAHSLAISCDTVYYQFGYEYYVRYVRSGKQSEIMQQDLGQMGFGRVSGIDLPGESAGRIPTRAYKFDLIEDNRDIYGDALSLWLPGDNVNMSIGQGFSLVTPLQMAVAYSAIANGGTVYEPHVGLRLERPDGTLVRRIAPEAVGKLPITPRQVAYLRDSLRGVTEIGTADEAFLGFPLDRIPVAGKTGTAEVPPKQDYSWFAAMAPADDPRYVVVGLIEQGGHGSTTAAPLVRRILEGLFGLQPAKTLEDGGVTD
ncbi:MAG: penicillin-binding protein 2 [Actinobacteria bacterium]|nr:penicillin-binding protein 2 [Actinomycetota bacterium]